ncbi:MAG: hypothetical protein IKJ47_05915 [Oscillospiraceae bacterium]|nr:hypothetical protein [Oscillospiraceae bacterium]
MTIIDLLGEKRFFYEIDGITYRQKSVKLPGDYEIFEEDFNLYVKHNRKTNLICEGVGAWTIFRAINIILSYDMNHRKNDFRVIDFDGNTVMTGGVSPDGYLYYFEDNLMLKEKPFPVETQVVKKFDFVPSTVEYDNDVIYIWPEDSNDFIKQDYI